MYHFEIRNLENGTIECVGSDHINTYLIMKEISVRTGRDIADISDGEIDSWIQERTKSMIAEAWMHKNGKMFNDIYERISNPNGLLIHNKELVNVFAAIMLCITLRLET